jgi:hypothetical protein
MRVAKPHQIFPHGLPEQLQPGLWRVVGSLPYPLKRNMFIYRLRDGGLLLYSVVAMDDSGMAALERLGKPTIMVVPHPLHIMDARFYKQRYPHLRVFGMADAQARLPDMKFDSTPAEALAPEGISAHLIPGMRYSEVALELPVDGGHAIIFTDIVSRLEGKPNWIMKLLGPPQGNGVSRIVKLRQVADKEQVRGFLRRLAATPGVRLAAGCHGGVVTQDCSAWLAAVAERL